VAQVPWNQLHREVRLVVLDVDGTLLCRDGTLSTENTAAIRLTEATGVRVMLATGKTVASVLAHHRRLGLTTPIVASQGTVVASADGTIRWRHRLDPEALRSGLALIEQMDIEVFVYAGDRVLAARETPYSRRLGGQYEEPVVYVDDLQAASVDGADKLLLHLDDRLHAEVRPRLTAALGPHTRLVQAVAESIEVLPVGVSKGATVGELLGELGVTYAEVLAIGDGENDLETLRSAGVSAAVGNAIPQVKAMVDLVVATNDDHGVADALHRVILDGDGVGMSPRYRSDGASGAASTTNSTSRS
jgi:5-amino-6-(5-phospho-D-ribitylamino)uracil phosphatase